ncbi:tetratricopeptide repeat protein [Alteromonadaceae bacterium BrNp21-10]|nr:tetratricopeptide repeat protein [Alteromonadaceae bacterium BrNp21-10]
MKKSLIKACSLLLLLTATKVSAAEVAIHFGEPKWQFLIANQPLGNTTAQLQTNESSFARSIQPLLENKDYAGVLKAFANRPLAEDSAALQLLRGQVLLSEKDYANAADALTAALQKMPDLALAHRTLSMVYMLQKQYKNARPHLVRSIELGVADDQLYGQLAYINLQSDQPFSAVAGYQQALFLAPDNQQWQQGMLYALMQSRAWDQAGALLEQQLFARPKDAQLWLMRSQIALQQQHEGSALASLETAIRLGDDDTANLLTAARLHLRHGSVPRAISLLESSLTTVTTTHSDQVFAALDQILPWLLSQGKEQGAARLLKVTESLKPVEAQQAKLNLYRGQLAVQQNHNKDAMTYLTQAIEQNPVLGEALLALAKLYQQQNKVQQAQLYFVRASALSEVKQRALLAHAQLQIDQKNYSQALGLLHKVLRDDPNRRDIQHNIRELQQLVRQDQYAS